MDYERIIPKLKKLKAIADSQGDEAENARRQLNAFLAHYKIDEAALGEGQEPVEDHAYAYGFDEAKKFVFRVCAHNLGLELWGRRKAGSKKKKRAYIVKCTAVQWIELSAMVDFYLERYVEEKAIFDEAFAHKHRLFAHESLLAADDQSPRAEMSDEAIRKMMSYMYGMSSASFRKQIEE